MCLGHVRCFADTQCLGFSSCAFCFEVRGNDLVSRLPMEETALASAEAPRLTVVEVKVSVSISKIDAVALSERGVLVAKDVSVERQADAWLMGIASRLSNRSLLVLHAFPNCHPRSSLANSANLACCSFKAAVEVARCRTCTVPWEECTGVKRPLCMPGGVIDVRYELRVPTHLELKSWGVPYLAAPGWSFGAVARHVRARKLNPKGFSCTLLFKC